MIVVAYRIARDTQRSIEASKSSFVPPYGTVFRTDTTIVTLNKSASASGSHSLYCSSLKTAPDQTCT